MGITAGRNTKNMKNHFLPQNVFKLAQIQPMYRGAPNSTSLFYKIKEFDQEKIVTIEILDLDLDFRFRFRFRF